MRKWWPLVVAVVWLCVGFGVWWDHSGQHWVAVQTGTYCGSTGTHYCYWSGFGSVLPWALFSMGGIFTGVWLLFKHTNCHVKGCPRVGRFPLAGGEYKVCGHHHQGFDGHHPTMSHIWNRHQEHKAHHG